MIGLTEFGSQRDDAKAFSQVEIATGRANKVGFGAYPREDAEPTRNERAWLDSFRSDREAGVLAEPEHQIQRLDRDAGCALAEIVEDPDEQ